MAKQYIHNQAANRIKWLRKCRNMTQLDLANAIRMSSRTIGRIENPHQGRYHCVNKDTADRVATALGFTRKDLFAIIY